MDAIHRLGLLLCLVVPLSAWGAAQEPGAAGGGAQRYIVEFEQAPLAAWAGGETRDGHRLKATAPAATGAARLDPESAASLAYLEYLDGERKRLLERAGLALGRDLAPERAYRYAFNGVALTLSAGEAARLARLESVARVTPDETLQLETDAGPEWIGAPEVWSGAAPFSGEGNQGEGVVIGVVDSGINAGHESFAAQGADGHQHTNPRGRFFGLCASGEASCNSKLIGIYDFTEEGSDGADTTGHGTHVAGIAAGNHVDARLRGHTLDMDVGISGVAPHANLISYKACRSGDQDQPEGCPLSALLDALDQALRDGVDVINYSIGSRATRESPWRRPDATAMRNAVAAGIVMVSSAGNRGPRAESLTHPATAPWVIAVGNATHDRRFVNRLQDMSGGVGTPPPTLTGVGFTGDFGPADIVHAADFEHPLCGEGPMDFPPTGASNPFPDGTFDGEIVVCDRGVYARVEKGFNVREAGAGGYVLANTEEWGESIVSDDHFLPGVHLGFEDGERLRDWLAAGDGHQAQISGAEQSRDPAFGDAVAGSSSRGPTPFTPHVMKPDLTAPGTDVLAADMPEDGQVNRYQFLTGTSMAAPHIAGAAALLRARHPGWSVAAVRSALVTTAIADGMTDAADDGPAGIRARGAGRVDPAAAIAAGLVLEENVNAFRAANPDQGGDPATLNLPALAHDDCFLSCGWTRTVTSVRNRDITWRAEVEVPDGVEVQVTPEQFTLGTAGDSRALDIEVVVRDAPVRAWIDGAVRLVPVAGGGTTPPAVLPLSVFVSGGNTPERIQINADQRSGSEFVPLDDLVALPDLALSAFGPAPGNATRHSLNQDPSRGDPYSDLDEGGTFFRMVTVRPGDRMLVAEIVTSNARDTDLFVGRDTGSGEPAAAEELCAGVSSGPLERCVLEDPAPGDYWVLIQNWEARGSFDSVGLVTAVVPGSATGLTATGPGRVPERQPFEVRLAWDRADMSPDSRWYGALGVGTAPERGNNVGLVPVTLLRSDAAALAPVGLAPGQERRFSLPGNRAHQGLFIDLPPDATALMVHAEGDDAADLQLFARRGEPFSGDTAAALGEEADAEGFKIPRGARLELVGATAPEPGRWFIAPFNGAADATSFTLLVQVETREDLLGFQRGMWFNPARAGHGIDLNRSGENLFVVWFTYLEDNTPVWYLASGPIEGNIWSAPLERIAWNGDSVRPTEVGRATLTFESPEAAVFTWRLHGLTGSEHFTPCAPGMCIPPGNDAPPADGTGHWFDPGEPGWGDTVVTRGDFELHTLYIYDDSGNPRWLQGVNDQRDATNVTELLAFEGFCPLCERVEPTTVPAGELVADFIDVEFAVYGLGAVLPDAWPGEWQRDTTVQMLSDPPD